MNIRVALILIFVLSLAACASLPQSALIYSSRSTFGLSVTSNPASASGVTMSVGYDALDAAYVPIAVAPQNKDSESSGAVTKITAQYDTTSNDDQEQLTAASKAKLDAYVDARNVEANIEAKIQDLANKKTPIESLKNKVNDATIKLNEAKSSKSDTTQAQDALDEANAELARAQADNADIDTQIEQITSTTLKDAKQDAESKRTAAVQAAGLLKLGKSDALSVYGRFGADSKDSTSAISLEMGKIFSTGVAAQNLTEAAGAAASTDAFAKCLDVAKSSSSDPAYIKTLTDNCLSLSNASKKSSNQAH